MKASEVVVFLWKENNVGEYIRQVSGSGRNKTAKMLPNSQSSIEGPSKTQTRYKGLFTSQMAPTSRAYCILFSFFIGVLMITMGSVFYHVIEIKPMSGVHPIHTPPVALACTLIAAGIVLVLLSVGVAWKLGMDDGDDSLEDDSFAFAKDDILDQYHQFPPKNPVWEFRHARSHRRIESVSVWALLFIRRFPNTLCRRWKLSPVSRTWENVSENGVKPNKKMWRKWNSDCT